MLLQKKKKLKNLRKDKGKDERPIRSHVINLLEDEYEISSAAYHGGDLNGVCCRRLLTDGMKIFGDIIFFLMQYDYHYEDHCLDATIGIVCGLHGYLCSVLDNLSSVLWKKYGELNAEDLDDAATLALKNLDYLWTTANLGIMPKFYSLLEHALQQASNIGGFGDMLEDDVEMMHQIAGRFESRASKIKGLEKQALSHAKMEAIMHSKDVQKNIKDSQKTAKHTLTVNKQEERRKRLKSERDEV
jgi:hypothetical protein